MKIKLPCKVIIGKKTYALNKNREKNWHYMVYSKAKSTFTENVLPTLPDIKISKYPIKCIYTYYHGSRHKADLDNVLSVVKKFTQDTLKAKGIIEDDNWEYINHVEYKFGGYAEDKESYCILEIEGI